MPATTRFHGFSADREERQLTARERQLLRLFGVAPARSEKETELIGFYRRPVCSRSYDPCLLLAHGPDIILEIDNARAKFRTLSTPGTGTVSKSALAPATGPNVVSIERNQKKGGRRQWKRPAVVARMLADLNSGQITPDGLQQMPQKIITGKYQAAHELCSKAVAEAVAEFNSRQMPLIAKKRHR